MKHVSLATIFGLATLAVALPASAAVLTTGVVDPDPPVSGQSLRVGYGADGSGQALVTGR